MSIHSPSEPAARTPAAEASALGVFRAAPPVSWLARGLTATWWYTAVSVVFYQMMTLVLLLVPILATRGGPDFVLRLVLFCVGAGIWLAASVVLLGRYRQETLRTDPGRRPGRSPGTALALLGGITGGALIGLGVGAMLIGLACAASAISLLRWTPGVRLRVAAAFTTVLTFVWWLEGTRPAELADLVLLHPFFAIFLTPATVLTLWWWDVIVELDRARRVESKLAATDERLRLASDLHDLQGHHLQVIALQLELADRLLPGDPLAAIEQVRLARGAVDAAREGTRALATRFRGVPLTDELANAADLLRAAGLRVELDIARDADEAPAAVLGPVVRESTTNILKHGSGAWAELALTRTGEVWTLRLANEVVTDALPADRAGAGLGGIRQRVAQVGGELRVEESGGRFVVVVSVPTEAQGSPAR